MPPLYKIANWHDLYESRESHRTSGPMKWIPVVTKTDGFGFGLLRQQKNRSELLAAWYLLLGVAAKQDREHRGSISRDGVALTPDDLELMTGFPAKIFSEAFEFFTQPRQGWLVKDVCAESRAVCANLPLEDITLDKNRVDDKRGDQNAAGAAPASISENKLPAKQTDAEWLDSLRANPAYEGIDVMRVHGKMVAWCQTNRKQPNRRRFINWLNREERPMGASGKKSEFSGAF